MVDWKDEKVTIRVDRIVQNHDYEVKGEVLVRTTAEAGPSHVHGPARFTLTSTPARKTLAKLLEERIDSVDWYAVIEQLCVAILEHYRQGEPVVRLSELPPPEHTPYRLAPILFDGKPNLLYGFGGTLKSTFANLCTLLIATGLTAHHLTPRQGNVLYLDYETDAQEHRQRLDMLAEGMGITCPPNIFYRYCTQPIAADIADIQRIVTTEAITFLIVDSALGACGASLNDDEAAGRTFLALRSLRIGSLTLAHRRKNNPDGSGPLGSVYWTNSPRAVYETRAAEQTDKAVQEVGLFPGKVNWGERVTPRGFAYHFNSHGIVVNDIGVSSVPDLEERLPLFERIASRIERDGPQAVGDLSEWLGQAGKAVSESSVRGTLNRYDKLFVHIKGGEHAGKWAKRALESSF